MSFPGLKYKPKEILEIYKASTNSFIVDTKYLLSQILSHPQNFAPSTTKTAQNILNRY